MCGVEQRSQTPMGFGVLSVKPIGKMWTQWFSANKSVLKGLGKSTDFQIWFCFVFRNFGNSPFKPNVQIICGILMRILSHKYVYCPEQFYLTPSQRCSYYWWNGWLSCCVGHRCQLQWKWRFTIWLLSHTYVHLLCIEFKRIYNCALILFN